MRKKTRIRRFSLVIGGALALVVALPTIALAAPPAALPGNADTMEQTYQPAYDYDTDGCYPTPAIGANGAVNGGLNPSGALNGGCHDLADLNNTNGYARYKCNNGWCAILYGLYFEKDQATIGGHRHDWEHVVVWVQNNQAQYVSTSAHGNFNVYPRSQIIWDGNHPKIVYHKDGVSTHDFRPANSGDEPPENELHTWRYPTLVGWNGYPAGVRDQLSAADFGSAIFGLKDGNFNSHLAAAMPAGISFNPNA